MRLKSFVFVAFLGSLPVVAACDALLEEDPEEDGTPTPTNTNTPTPVPSVAPTPVTTTVGDIITLDWGTIDLPAGQSPHFDFTAPVGTISIDFMAIGGPADQSKIFGFFSIDGPNGDVIDATGGAPARQAVAEGAMSFSVPSDDSSATAATAGSWRFHVFAGNDTSFLTSDPQILVKIRTAPSGVPIGEIDVNVIVVQGVGINATQACTPGNSVYDGIAGASALYDQNLGLTISAATIACYDLSNSTQFTDINGDTGELGDLFETSAGLTDERINLFIVNSFSGLFASAAGIAGSVPIPMQVNGTRTSGVAILYQTSVLNMEETIAHEMGHALGLYHTSEFNNGGAASQLDPISDTPTCPALGMSDPGTCPDDTNVMFPQLTGSFFSFSAGQGVVLAPAVHVRRQDVSAFAPAQDWVRTPHQRVWVGPPLRCVNGVVGDF